MSAKQPSPNSPTNSTERELPRPTGSASSLTFAALAGLMADLPPPPKWIAATMSPAGIIALRKRIPERQDGNPWHSTGFPIHEKEGQVAEAWMFSDLKLMQRYLDGELTELDLFEMMRTGACKPNSS